MLAYRMGIIVKLSYNYFNCFVWIYFLSGACFCGDSYGKYGKSYQCTKPCAGNSNQICGNGDTNSIYDVSVVSGQKPVNLVACDGNVLHISCPSSKQIKLTTANFGRQDSSICCNNPSVCTNTKCIKDVTSLSSNYCRGNSCDIPASSAAYGDPCFGTSKYLKVDYSCV